MEEESIGVKTRHASDFHIKLFSTTTPEGSVKYSFTLLNICHIHIWFPRVT